MLFVRLSSGSSPKGLVRLRPSRPHRQHPAEWTDNANTYTEARVSAKSEILIADLALVILKIIFLIES